MWMLLLLLIVILLVARSRSLKQRQEDVMQALDDIRGAVESLTRRLESTERRVGELETTASLGAPFIAREPSDATAPVAGVAEARAAAAEGPAEEVEPVKAEPEPVVERHPRIEILGVEPARESTAARAAEEERVSEFTLRRRQLEQRLMENWTGILGAAVVVAGVTFLGIYTALRMAPVYRFLLTLAAGGALVGVAWFLGRKEQWRDFAAWVRSAGAAIVLFACAAAGGLPGLGLQWIHDPWPALGLLLAGIAANLLLAFAAGTQSLATLHVVLSLLPLMIVPPTPASIAIASAVAACGVALAFRGRWDRHLAVVLGAYLLFHLAWIGRQGQWADLGGTGYFAAACAVLVFLAGALVHYRKDYAQPSPPPLQVGVHLANWALLAVAMFVYVPDSIARGAILLAFGVVAYRFARRGLVLSVPWLYRADTLTAQALVLLALLSGFDLGASTPLMLLIALIETLAFRWTLDPGQDQVVDLLTDRLPVAAAVLLTLVGISEITSRPGAGLDLAAIMAAGCVCAVVGQRLLRRNSADHQAADPAFLGTPGELLGLMAGPLLLVALGALMQRTWMELAALASVTVLMVAWHRVGRSGLLTAVAIALVGTHVLSWDQLVVHRDWSAYEITLRILPLAALAGAAIRFAGKGWLRLTAIALFGTSVGLAAFLYFDPMSPLIPAVAWLILSLAALEVADRLESAESLTVLCLGYAYLVAFVLAYALVIVQTPAYIGTIRARALIELFAIGVLGYWWLFHPREPLAAARPWTRVHPLFLELILVGAAVTVIEEIQPLWWAVVWAVFAVVLLAPFAERLLDARSRLYSLLFYWVSVADMAVVMSTMEMPSRDWFERPEFTSLLAIGLQIAYVAYSHRRLVLEDVEAPPPLRALGRLAQAVGRRRNHFVYYPLFLGIAIFLFRRFDRSLLTLLWAAEAFVVFGLSAWLRENQFRILALGGLGACLVRLVVIDMAEADLVLRGVVFIGVGLLMLGMNAIYNRYRARFQS